MKCIALCSVSQTTVWFSRCCSAYPSDEHVVGCIIYTLRDNNRWEHVQGMLTGTVVGVADNWWISNWNDLRWVTGKCQSYQILEIKLKGSLFQSMCWTSSDRNQHQIDSMDFMGAINNVSSEAHTWMEDGNVDRIVYRENYWGMVALRDAIDMMDWNGFHYWKKYKVQPLSPPTGRCPAWSPWRCRRPNCDLFAKCPN